MKGVYLLHFDRELQGFPKVHLYGDTQHYIGCSFDIDARLEQHQAGEGSKMTIAAKAQGIKLTVAALWPMTNEARVREVEQKLTKIGARTLCPICQVNAYVTPERPDVVTTKQNHVCNMCGFAIHAGSIAAVVNDKLVHYSHTKDKED